MVDDYFPDWVAKTYDADHGGTDPALVARTVKVLHDLAEGGPVLEFAVGTGRIALPLAARGLDVAGIELSRAMVAELRRKETGTPLEVAIGDMTTTRVAGEFSLVVLVFNTIDNLVTQEAQVRCFANAAAHLAPGGRFVVETQVPPVQRLPYGETLSAFAASPEHMGIDDIDIATQRYTSNHSWVEEGRTTHLSIPFRYAWPAELDLMARLAGLEPEHRWGDWHRAPFTNLSRSHVSVWRRPRAA